MSDLENQLRAALRRHDPPPGFAERVIEHTRRADAHPLAMAAQVPAIATRRSGWRPVWSIGAIAATLTLVSFSVTSYQRSREEHAAHQAQLALRIAAEKLNLTRDRVFENTVFENAKENDDR